MKPLTDLIADLITEHGSAAILRERLEQLKAEKKPLLDANQELRARVTELEDIVRRLTAELKDQAKPDNLPGDAERILLLFFNEDTVFMGSQIAFHFSMKPSVAKHHLDTLRKRSLLQSRFALTKQYPEPRLNITDVGRAYVMENLSSHL